MGVTNFVFELNGSLIFKNIVKTINLSCLLPPPWTVSKHSANHKHVKKDSFNRPFATRIIISSIRIRIQRTCRNVFVLRLLKEMPGNNLIDTFQKIFAKAIIVKNNEPLNNEKAKRMNESSISSFLVCFSSLGAGKSFVSLTSAMAGSMGDLTKNKKDFLINAYLCHCCQ